MRTCYVRLIDSDTKQHAGYLARGERRQTVMCGTIYRAYHFLTRSEAEQAAHHFCQEEKGMAVDLERGENREYDFGFEIVND